MSLWVSQWSLAMGAATIYDSITRATHAKFGHEISPHLFRDCAATSIAIEDPAHVRITMRILGHSKIATSEQYYNHAQSRVATGRYQDHIAELRRQSRDGVVCGAASPNPEA
jgi:site-specific recombinase XerD